MTQQPEIKKSMVSVQSGGNDSRGRIEIEDIGGRPLTKEEEIRMSAEKIAREILTLTRNGLFVSLRFMDVALCQFKYVSNDLADIPFNVRSTATTTEYLIFDTRYIIEQYMRDKKALSRDYLHMVLHCVFRHPFVSSKLNAEYWDLACDIAVEATVCELELRQTAVLNSNEINDEIIRIRQLVGSMNAEHIYRYLLSEEVSMKDLVKWKALFTRDEHDIWWEIASRIEEEKRKKAEEEAAKQESYDEDKEEDFQKEDASEEGEEESEETSEEDEEGSEEEDGTEEDREESGDGDDQTESGEEDTDDSEGEMFEEGTEEGEDETGPEEDSEQSEEDDQEDEFEEPDEDVFEDEYTSSPGGSNENEESSLGDPDSEHHDSGEESSGDGEGGGNPGDDPEGSDEEGADRDNDADASGLEGSDDGHDPGKNDKSGDIGGQTDEGVIDDSEYQDPFGEQNQQGNNEPKPGGISQKSGSQDGTHNAGTGGGGSGSQAAWQHTGDGDSSRDGERDMSDRQQLDGAVRPQDDPEQAEGEIDKREAKVEKGTADSDREQDKAPAFMHDGDAQDELEEKWKEISERILVDLETSSKEWGEKSDVMVQGIKKINRDKYDYRTFLQKFSTLREDIQLNDDEFDYVYYTFGLDHYGNIPLVEPLEYKEVRKVRDFVIAIDTSGSCAGEVVQKFLDKTYSILNQQENFFRKINLHIIQCDATIQSDVKITNKEEFNDYMKTLEFKGFGGTDFRPVFTYVNEMIDHGEFDDLKGLIYFTDGNGTYPKKRPPYETAFVFVDDDDFDYQVPSWAMKLVLETSDIMDEIVI